SGGCQRAVLPSGRRAVRSRRLRPLRLRERLTPSVVAPGRRRRRWTQFGRDYRRGVRRGGASGGSRERANKNLTSAFAAKAQPAAAAAEDARTTRMHYV